MGRIIVGSIASIIAVALLGTAASKYLGQVQDESLAGESGDWSSVMGVVTASEVNDSGPSRSGRGRAGGFAGPGREFWPIVSYRYTVEDREYESSRVAFGDIRSKTYQPAEAIVDKYPVDQAAEVFYDPSDHSQAVLIRGGAPESSLGWPIGLAIAGVVFGVIGVGYFIEARRRRDDPFG